MWGNRFFILFFLIFSFSSASFADFSDIEDAREELRDQRKSVQYARENLRREIINGDPYNIREARRDLREATSEYRRAKRELRRQKEAYRRERRKNPYFTRRSTGRYRIYRDRDYRAPRTYIYNYPSNITIEERYERLRRVGEGKLYVPHRDDLLKDQNVHIKQKGVHITGSMKRD